MKTLTKRGNAPLKVFQSALTIAEARYHEAQERADYCPSDENDEWLYWSKMQYERELAKAAKREAAILKDLNSADLNQGRVPREVASYEKYLFWAALGLVCVGAGCLIIWLFKHPVGARI